MAVLWLFQFQASASEPIYQDRTAPIEARVENLFTNLTQDEKINLLSGNNFITAPIPRLGIPRLSMADAGQGVVGGIDSTRGPATAFPAAVAMASTWDPALVSRIGQAIGVEALNKGTGTPMMLGPAVNIHRSPLGGRNGEYFSEDPFLTARLTVGYIQGMQSSGVAACVKHYVAYNQETDRYTIDVRVGERALREIYMPAFEAAVKEAHVWTVMSSYNQINGYKAAANKYLMVDVLKKCWSFDGMLVSDWGGVQDTVGPLNAGNDLEMPGQEYMTHDKVAAALKNHQVSQASIDDSVRRILRTIVRVGLLDGPRTPNPSLVNSPEHQRLCFEAATEGIVLLKNSEAVLPLGEQNIHSVACIGAAAANWEIGASGSPKVTPFNSVSALEGIRKRAGTAIKVNYSLGIREGAPIPQSAFQSAGQSGLQAEYFANPNLEGKPTLVRIDSQIQFDWSEKAPAAGLSQSAFSVRWTGTVTAPASGRYKLNLVADDGCRLFLDDKLIINHWVDSAAVSQIAEVDLTAGQSRNLRVEYFQRGGQAVANLNWSMAGQEPYADAIHAAKASDVAIVFVTTRGTEGETSDRQSMALPDDQDDLIRAVAAANKKTVVVLNNGTPVLMPWLDQIAGLVEAWFPGERGGDALAAILFGDANPSGKLPTTLAARREDYPDFGHFPGFNKHVTYAEGIYVGYRHFDKEGIAPLFSFGHGLSYTSFRYSNLRTSRATLTTNGSVTVTVDVCNTGKRDGTEVVQLYVHSPKSRIDKPVRELRGFQRVALAAGQTKSVSFELRPRALSYCDVPGKQWKADAGSYELQVGASSHDIRLRAPLRLKSTYTEAIPFLEEQSPATPDRDDLAAYHPTTSSSVKGDDTYGSEAALATDGNDSTYWRSGNSDLQWLAVDLGKPEKVDHIRLKWGHDKFKEDYAIAYRIQVGPDGQTWTDIYNIENGCGGEREIKFPPVLTRWVRLLCLKSATNDGYKLVSFEVFGPNK